MTPINRIAQRLCELESQSESSGLIHYSIGGRATGDSEPSVVVIPLGQDKAPAGAAVPGKLSEISDDGLVLTLDCLPRPLTPALIVGVETAPERTNYAAAEILATFPGSAGRVVVHSVFGGAGDALLQPRNLTPRFDFESMSFTLGVPAQVLHQWQSLGVIEAVVIDRLLLCPRCHGLPTFRHGCRRCGSGRVVKTRGDCRGFAAPRAATPGKGADPSSYFCSDCRWLDRELVGVNQCLHCAHRFSAQEAYEMVLQGYHANRLGTTAADQLR